jgi:hypothetical protein
MRGAIPPLPNTPSWHGAQLKNRDNRRGKDALYEKYLRLAERLLASQVSLCSMKLTDFHCDRDSSRDLTPSSETSNCLHHMHIWVAINRM